MVGLKRNEQLNVFTEGKNQMTWVVGAGTPFGYGVMVSDICVTLGDGTTRDCLRKSYPVGRFVVAGFAGSVAIGMQLIDSLRDFLHMSPEESADEQVWEPQWVAENFSPHARTIFAQFPEDERSSQSHLMLVGVQPVENVLGGAQSVIAVLRSPSYTPEIKTGGGQVMAIGSGSQQNEAMRILNAQVNNHNLLGTEVMNPGGFGRAVAFGMTRDLFFGAPVGISRHLHVTVVNSRGLFFTANDVEYQPRHGALEVLRMPPVAESMQQLETLLGISRDTARGIQARIHTTPAKKVLTCDHVNLAARKYRLPRS